MTMLNKIIIIPDVHGRVFWKEAVKQASSDDLVVFLGDYLEPYTDYEGITHQQSYDNFLEILEYKRSHMDNTILLLGNHDFACIDKSMVSCRHDRLNEERNHKTFIDNLSLFRLIFTVGVVREDGSRLTYIFSHSGIHKNWIDDQVSYLLEEGHNDDIPYIEKTLNSLLTEDEIFRLYQSLSVYSNYRGWSFYNYGSCIWADCREWEPEMPEFENTYQIFGHTQLDSQPIVTDYWSNLDCRRAFILNPANGELTELSGKIVEKTKMGETEDEQQ